MNPTELFSEVESASPSFGRAVAEHVAYYGELLSHVLMADLLRHVGSHFQRGDNAPSEAEVRATLALLDAAIVSGNEETANAIAVSFCEHIQTEPFFDELWPLLGIHLQEQVRSFDAR